MFQSYISHTLKSRVQLVSQKGRSCIEFNLVRQIKWRKARHNTVLAHARAYEVYDTEFREEQNGIIGITLNSEWYHPEDPTDPDDILASDTAMALSAGWWAWPIYG